jgi:hypothetical protein
MDPTAFKRTLRSGLSREKVNLFLPVLSHHVSKDAAYEKSKGKPDGHAFQEPFEHQQLSLFVPRKRTVTAKFFMQLHGSLSGEASRLQYLLFEWTVYINDIEYEWRTTTLNKEGACAVAVLSIYSCGS